MRIKRIIAALALLCLCVCLLPLRAEAAGYYTEDDLENIRCTLISDPHRADYVDRVMAWHILSSTNDYRVGRNLSRGKNVVFIFDGCSDKVDDPVYGNFENYHISAYCAVVKEVDGKLRIVYESDNCATIPDFPRLPELNGGNNVPTLLDGVYNIFSKNHQGRYSALRVEDYSRTAPVIRCNPTGSYLSTAVGINIHARSIFPDVTPNSVAEGTYSSTGCLNVGLSDDGWKEYDEFIYQIMGVTDAVTTSTFDIGTRCREWVDMGVVIVDRSHYKEQLKAIYGDDGNRTAEEIVNTITKYTDELGFGPTGCTYSETVTQPSCTSGGGTTYTCTVCGDSYTEGASEPLGHSYGEAVTVAASCTDAGSVTRTCTVCGHVVTDSELPVLGHAYGEAVIVGGSCTEFGVSTRTCSRCGDTQTEDSTVLGHQYGEIVVTEATCTEDGYATRTCTVCGAVKAEVEIVALGHTYENSQCIRCGDTDGLLRGDANGDGTVDADDAIRLLFHVFFGSDNYPVTQAGDFNGDGDVNSDDAVRLLFHVLFGGEDYPLN